MNKLYLFVAHLRCQSLLFNFKVKSEINNVCIIYPPRLREININFAHLWKKKLGDCIIKVVHLYMTLLNTNRPWFHTKSPSLQYEVLQIHLKKVIMVQLFTDVV